MLELNTNVTNTEKNKTKINIFTVTPKQTLMAWVGIYKVRFELLGVKNSLFSRLFLYINLKNLLGFVIRI